MKTGSRPGRFTLPTSSSWPAIPPQSNSGEEGYRLLDELGEKGGQSYAAGKLAQALYALDRLEEADAWAGRAAELGASDDALTQMLWRQVRANLPVGLRA